MAHYWLSFVDPNRPKGDRFLGACIIETDATEPSIIVREAWLLGCNPGGEVKLTEAGDAACDAIRGVGVPTGKLMTRAECEAWDIKLLKWIEDQELLTIPKIDDSVYVCPTHNQVDSEDLN